MTTRKLQLNNKSNDYSSSYFNNNKRNEVMKTYNVQLTQTFEDTTQVEANSKEEAEKKVRDEWECSVGADVVIHSITESKNQ